MPACQRGRGGNQAFTRDCDTRSGAVRGKEGGVKLQKSMPC